MAIDTLQEKIRKTKNPSVIELSLYSELIPPAVVEAEESFCAGAYRYFSRLMAAMKGMVPAIRFGFGSYAIFGADGLAILQKLLLEADSAGYYVILDLPEMLSPMAAENTAALLRDWPCDGVILSTYLGSDILRPFVNWCKDEKKDLFAVVRTGNKTAPELQDLLTGSRLVHTAAADLVSRYADSLIGRCGYSQIAMVAGASAADSIRSLRAKYKRSFLLLDGFDYPNANAKNCSYGFDKLGHGAIACACASVIGAWKQEDAGDDYIALAVDTAARMKKNLTRYVTIL